MNKSFENLELRDELKKTLSDLEFTEMTEIQSLAIPVILEGQDITAIAKTGSGKTLVFGLGILNSLDSTNLTLSSLVICPTRELADQVASEIRKFARLIKNTKVITICGGTSQIHQEKSLEYGSQIIVGTPGRLLKLIKEKKISLKGIKNFILDEADKMLDMGFIEDIMEIEKFTPRDKQSLFFSATFPERIQELSSSIQNNSKFIKTKQEESEILISEKFIELLSHKDKESSLIKLLAEYKPQRFIIFCRTKIITDKVNNLLNDHGIISESMHGDLDQNERNVVLRMFDNQSLSSLVATDVAARGLDIGGLDAIINFDLPSKKEEYIHRIGRTGRAGNKGLAFSFFIDKQRKLVDEFCENRFELERSDFIDVMDLNEEQEYNLLPPMCTLYISRGKKDKLRPGDILGAIIGETGITDKSIGKINILNIISYVAIERSKADLVIDNMKNKKIKKKNIKIGFA
ncbi:ATP-dependent RNA helicase DbpA [Bacteriovoracaceae bacterium]|nr:ATP-dependent RNA helicase DbpA [Bacteriovoracaceae bacterium]